MKEISDINNQINSVEHEQDALKKNIESFEMSA